LYCGCVLRLLLESSRLRVIVLRLERLATSPCQTIQKLNVVCCYQALTEMREDLGGKEKMWD
jgi:hypothetical protein